MACHLGSLDRYETIKEALKSIGDQIKLPHHVYISYSYDLEEPNIDDWKKCINNIPLTVINHEYKNCQFEHYKQLLQFVLDNDIISFINDNDLYSPHKIDKVMQCFNTYNNINIILHGSKRFHNINKPNMRFLEEYDTPKYICGNEHVNISCKGYIFKLWFTTNEYEKSYLETRDFIDFDFQIFIQKKYKFEVINYIFYYQRCGLQNDYD